MTTNLLLLIALITAHSFDCNATIMDGHKVLDIDISKSGLTRISVEGKSIQDVFIHPADLNEHIQLHKSGHVFVAPQGLKDAVFITIITSDGTPQDLKLILKQKKSQPIVLQTANASHKGPQEPKISRILHSFIQGRLPPGFREQPFFDRRPRQANGITATPSKSFSNNCYQIDQYEVTTTSKEPVPLDESPFSEPLDKALSFTKRQISSGETAYLYVVKGATAINTKGSTTS